IPGDALSAQHLICNYISRKKLNATVVTTDLGFAKGGRNFAASLGFPLAFVEKRRVDSATGREALTLIGSVAGRDVIIVDDLVDTAGSVEQAVNVVRQNGAKDVYLAFTHAVLSPPALERLAAADLKEIIMTDTLPIDPAQRLPNMTILTVAELLGEVIMRSHEGRSVGELFNE
uniref:ribose-phosphate diphosphokinase n=1 Tax=Promineifilum sp. TaxID=2664178 RepID=UPI0035AEE7BE